MGLLGQDPTVGCMQSALLVFPHHLQRMKHRCNSSGEHGASDNHQLASCTSRSTSAVLCGQVRHALRLWGSSSAQPPPLWLRQAQHSYNLIMQKSQQLLTHLQAGERAVPESLPYSPVPICCCCSRFLTLNTHDDQLHGTGFHYVTGLAAKDGALAA